MNKWLLTDEEFIQLFTDEQKRQGVPDRYNFAEAIAGDVIYHRMLAKAQAKKLVEWLLGRCEHFPPEVIGQPRYQCTKCLQILCKEVGLKEVKE